MNNFILTGFSDEISKDFSEQLKQIKKLNIAYIEIRGVNGRNITNHTIKEVEELKKQLDEAETKISAIGSPIGKINIEDDFEQHFELFKHTVKIAEILDTEYIRLFSFFMDTSKAFLYRKKVMKRMKAFKDYVEGSSIVLLHENEKDIFGDTAERCLDIYNTLNSPNFKLIFDPANFVQCNVETYPHAFKMLKEHVIYYHIKDALSNSGRVVPAGFGNGHINEIIKELHKDNFCGFLSLEPHLGNFEGFDELEGKANAAVLKENSDIGKFKLAAQSLINIIKEIKNG